MVDVTPFSYEETEIEGLLSIRIKQVTDERGTIREVFRASAFTDAGLAPLAPWQQVNVTETKRGALRGMHGEAMTKLVAIVSGTAHGAYVDARRDSPTFGAVVEVDLVPGVQVLVPAGVCNGFQGTSEQPCLYLYCFDQEWQPGMAGVAVNPLDPALGILWPLPIDPTDRLQISEKDLNAPALADLG